MNNNQTVERLKQMRLGAMASLHYQHIKDNRIENVTACLLYTSSDFICGITIISTSSNSSSSEINWALLVYLGFSSKIRSVIIALSDQFTTFPPSRLILENCGEWLLKTYVRFHAY